MDGLTGRIVALKLVAATSEHHGARVRREVQALRRLEMDGVVRLLATGNHAAEPFLVLELVEGAPFPGRMRERSWRLLAHPTLALLSVLGRVHAAGIVHGDIKPSNVLVAPDGRVTLLDFGLARDTAQDLVNCEIGPDLAGTPRYLSPEQVLGGAPHAGADLYALGVMLFEALAGQPPFADESFWPRVLERRSPPAPRLADVAPGVSPALSGVIDQLLATEPELRPRSAEAAMRALQALNEAGPSPYPCPLPTTSAGSIANHA